MEVVFGEGKQIEEGIYSDNHTQVKCERITFPFARTAIHQVPVKRTCTLSHSKEAGDKHVLEITLDVRAHPDLQDFQPGDTVGILPQNRAEDVRHLLDRMQLLNKAHTTCQVRSTNTSKKPLKIPAHIPTGHTTPLTLLRDCLNLRAVPKKQFLRSLAECSADDAERDSLNALAEKDGAARYTELFLEKGTTLLELLDLFPSCQPTLSTLLAQLPRLLPRPYSIANSPLSDNKTMNIIFSVRNEQPGVTTQMLSKKTPDEQVLLYLREPNSFRYTDAEAYTNNQVLIAIGTGVAPFVGFLQHKQHLVAQASERQLGATWLFVGARNKACLPQREQLKEYHTAGVLNKYCESFSRSSEESEYRYVQEQLLSHSEMLIEFLLLPQTLLYVCADGAEISRSIEAALVQCLTTALSDESCAANLLKEFRASGKYREDVWA